jgi:predicted nucleic acid-binding protein
MSPDLTHYLVDTSIVIQHLLSDVHTAQAEALFDQLGETVMIHLPEFCFVECTNVLWKRVRFHGLSEVTAAGLTENLLALPITVVPTAGVLKRSLQIGLKHQLAVYDSIYIALAETLALPLITDDQRQAKAAQAEGVLLKPITDFAL